MVLHRPTQKEILKEVFHKCPNCWIPLPVILDLHIAQYGARILELRREGMNIQNRTKFENGIQKSWFMWITSTRDYTEQGTFRFELDKTKCIR